MKSNLSQSLAVFLLLNSASASTLRSHLEPVWHSQQHIGANGEDTFKYFDGPLDAHVQQAEPSAAAKREAQLKKDPDLAFGEANSPVMYNTRAGGAPGTEIDMHDDEPIIMGEVNMDDSSESGSDGEETEEDRQNYREALRRAEKVQTHAGRRTRKHKRKSTFSQNMVQNLQIDQRFVEDSAILTRSEKDDMVNPLVGGFDPSGRAGAAPLTFSQALDQVRVQGDPAADGSEKQISEGEKPTKGPGE